MVAFCALLPLVSTLVLFIGCPTPEIAGVTIDYAPAVPGASVARDVFQPCNSDCGCNMGYYTPVCGVDKKSYLNGCFAGCLASLSTNAHGDELSEKQYEQCGCVYPDRATFPHNAKEGLCDNGCNMFFPFMLGLFLLMGACCCASLSVFASAGYAFCLPLLSPLSRFSSGPAALL